VGIGLGQRCLQRGVCFLYASVHILGTVTLAWPGRMLCIRPGLQGLCAQTDQTTPLTPGEQIDVIGFLITGAFTPTLGYATYEATGFQQPVPYVAVTADQALLGNHDAKLVELEGQLVGQDETASDPSIGVARRWLNPDWQRNADDASSGSRIK
jgi:hypothetical protein